MPARPDRIPKHGTVSEYSNYGCRCSECKAAKAEQHRRWYAARREPVATCTKEYA